MFPAGSITVSPGSEHSEEKALYSSGSYAFLLSCPPTHTEYTTVLSTHSIPQVIEGVYRDNILLYDYLLLCHFPQVISPTFHSHNDPFLWPNYVPIDHFTDKDK